MSLDILYLGVQMQQSPASKTHNGGLTLSIAAHLTKEITSILSASLVDTP